MSHTIKERDYLFDNYKAFLIVLVVIGHFIQPCYKNNSFLYDLKYFIYTFHMPAFIFVSGYFSKKDVSWKTAAQKVLMPYVGFQIIYYVYYNYGIGIHTNWTLEYPKFSLWYLLALFIWKVVTPYFKKVPHFFLLSLFLGLGFGCLEVTGTFLSISRIVVFYPFFLAGMLLEKGTLEALRTYKNKCLCTAGLVVLTMFSRWMIHFFDFRLSYFYGKESYESLGMGNLEGILIRLACYALGFLFTYIFTILMTEKRFCFSKLGSSTISIYLFHGLLFKFLEHETNLLDSVNTVPETIGLLAFCVGLPFVFSLTPFCEIASLFGNFSFKNVFGADLREKISAFAKHVIYSNV